MDSKQEPLSDFHVGRLRHGCSPFSHYRASISTCALVQFAKTIAPSAPRS